MPQAKRLRTPYLLRPVWRGRWRTGRSKTRQPRLATKVGKKRCMPSNLGSSRKAARRPARKPHPISRKRSPVKNMRTRLPIQELARRTKESRRPSRTPITKSAPWICACSSRNGTSAGSSWPSPSRVTTQSPRASWNPAAYAADLPWRQAKAKNRWGEGSWRSRSRVASQEPSSTQHASQASPLALRAEEISSARAEMADSSLCTGMTRVSTMSSHGETGMRMAFIGFI